MKFGKELDRRSILKWKHNNINYNDLKNKIKLATSLIARDSVSSESSSTTVATAATQRRKLFLKELYKSFGKEIEFINLFVNTEHEKNLHYLLQLRERIEQLLSKYYQQDSKQEKLFDKTIKNKNFIRCCNEANMLLDNLNDLSQFINLQKLLLHKLFKKFIKYSSLSNKLEFIQHIRDKFLEGNPQSFVNIDLNPAIQELSLITDVLNSINENKKVELPQMIDNTFTKDIKFDVASTTKGVFRNSFLVHPDNLNELKIKLLKEFDLICNDEGKNNLNYLKKTASSASLHHRASFNSTTTTTEPISRSEYFQPDTEVNSVILGPPTLDNVHSLITSIPNNEFLLIAKVGGFKNIAYTKLSDRMMTTLLDPTLDREDKINKVRKLVTPSSDLRVLEWAVSTPLEAIYQLKFTRTRFIYKTASQTFYMTVDSNIETDAPYSRFAYCIFTTSYESVTKFPTSIENLVNSHLVYPMPLEFSLINFLNLKFYLRDTEKPEWFNDIESGKDIKKMPPQTVKPQHAVKGILLNKNEPKKSPSKKRQQKYWNEFDNGSDYENNEDTFYIDSYSSLPEDNQQILSPLNVNYILQITNKVVSFFQYIFGTPEPLRKWVPKLPSYGSFDSDTENDDDDENRQLTLSRIHSPHYNSNIKKKNFGILLEQQQYDKVLTVIYFFILFSSVLLDGISIGILYTLLANSLTNASILLIFIFVCFFFGLILSITGVCLINSRYNEPPAWHYFTTYLVLILNLIVICLGIKLTSPYLV